MLMEQMQGFFKMYYIFRVGVDLTFLGIWGVSVLKGVKYLENVKISRRKYLDGHLGRVDRFFFLNWKLEETYWKYSKGQRLKNVKENLKCLDEKEI